MNPQTRYQVFVSSTYEDLREERQQATQAILEVGGFPSGMELFPATDETQWELIKRVIEETDYYVVIVGGRYGTIGSNGISYTEMEYDYAVEKKIPVLGFVRDDLDNVPSKFTEKTEENRQKLLEFRQKVLSRTCRKFNNAGELGMAVMKSLMHEARIRPRTGWVRADQARSEQDRQRERKLQEFFEKKQSELEEANDKIEYLRREIRDRSVLVNDLPRDLLAQGDDEFEFTVTYRNPEKVFVTEEIAVTWNEIFKIIGPSLYGYIVRKASAQGEKPEYPFNDDIAQHLRSKIIEQAQGRKIEIQPGQVDTCVFQLKELGLIMFSEKEEQSGTTFRGITLTEYGEKQLSVLKTIRKK